jgi:hypothetical protein
MLASEGRDAGSVFRINTSLSQAPSYDGVNVNVDVDE